MYIYGILWCVGDGYELSRIEFVRYRLIIGKRRKPYSQAEIVNQMYNRLTDS